MMGVVCAADPMELSPPFSFTEIKAVTKPEGAIYAWLPLPSAGWAILPVQYCTLHQNRFAMTLGSPRELAASLFPALKLLHRLSRTEFLCD